MSFVKFNTIQEALSYQKSESFWLACLAGKFEAGNPTSYYSSLEPDEHLTYDISNNKVLVNVRFNGSLKWVTIFRSSYYCDTGHYWPGVWVHRDFTKYGPYSFSIKLGQTCVDLDTCKWPYRTSLLGNIFPITEFFGEEVKATVITYAPISEDGRIRPRGIIYGLLLENTSSKKFMGSVQLPRLFTTENVTPCPSIAMPNCTGNWNCWTLPSRGSTHTRKTWRLPAPRILRDWAARRDPRPDAGQIAFGPALASSKDVP